MTRAHSLLTTVAVAVVTQSEEVPDRLPAETTEFTLGNVAIALAFASLAAIPLAISLWALLDAARRPRWAWALSGRRQVVWMALVMFGALSVVGGLVISGWYLTKVRPAIAAVESGDL